ncbi:methionine ABC transporter ATP-binding protein [Jeotgalicoccus nanhaiensis]|uniref:Methionine ABC transporter ATP-binding protein n=1 Tax=Jeotgalicoccus nanhaiensis TaxID=568603 RepID=A0ABR9XXJ0_9STAP|nr:methionine ABC transporter ATP-binding protein [Jeotgalicoccus nanhaiensis]MBF0753719.1 methionine ABC transporter ATP-binding protein [Jeotgalicoccus nanhaiensis]TFU61883.1 methionine ABC transporter ATP-binding protein [Jeotgalicoccus nanhaiensis]
MIEFIDVDKTYPGSETPVHALDNINFKVDAGEIYGVVGYSGAGKSTLIRCVNQLESVSEGKVIVDGKDLTALTPSELRVTKKRIGMIFQHFNLLNSKTIYTNVAMPLILNKTPKNEIKARVSELLDFVGLSDKASQYPDQLSGGQKQRVGIARALATNPSILLCDEATSALDPQTTESILELLRKINKEYNITILLITHEMSVIRDVCHKVAVMENGKIIERGSVFDVFSNPETETGRRFVNTVMQTELPNYVQDLVQESDGQHIYRINFINQLAVKPYLSQISKLYDLDVNVLFGNITELQGIPFGNLIVQFDGSAPELEKALLYLEENNIHYSEVNTYAG